MCILRYFIYLTTFLIFLAGAPAIGGHVEGRETNVVLLDCESEKENIPPHIKVKAYSKNTSSAHVPAISQNKSCAQILHELLTHGFTLQQYENGGQWDFMLIRFDESKQEK